jgi:hypothetical protein
MTTSSATLSMLAMTAALVVGWHHAVTVADLVVAVLSAKDRDGVPCLPDGASAERSQDDGTTATGPSAWFRTAFLTEPGPGRPGKDAAAANNAAHPARTS